MTAHSGALLAAAGLAWSLALTPAPAAATVPAVDYADPVAWLCRPGRDDVCSRPLTSTVIAADGTRTGRTYGPDPAATIDCFYVYPTVSQETGANADMSPGPAEMRVAMAHLARFGPVCRTFAPIYRQTTIAALRGDAKGADRDLAYADVRAAWRSYLERDNHGRGVVLIGHSQGAHHLIRLIAEEIDGRPAQRLLVSAILAGGNLQVASGADAGGDFRNVPLCRSADQTGCAIAYSSYLADRPPGADSRFGKADRAGLAVACVDPAGLLGREALDDELVATPRVAAMLGTPLVENPGVIRAACTDAGGFSYLAVTVRADSAPTLARALSELDSRSPGWGLHALDINLCLGDLVEIVRRQAKAWAAAGR